MKETTKAKKKKFSWRINVDRRLKIPATLAADAANLELREYLSQQIEKSLFGENAAG